MNLEYIKNLLPSYAKDLKLNLATVLSEDDSSGLNLKQIYGIALASALATKNSIIIDAMLTQSQQYLDEKAIEAAKAASAIMAMNNVYYRFLHLVNDSEYSKLPARLRMNVIANPGIDKIDFELLCLAVSAINGCGLCIESHTRQLERIGISKLGIQATIRIAAVINAAALALILK